MSTKPTAAQIADAKKSVPVYHPETPELRASWSVLNPRGAEIHYASREEAAQAAATGIY
jgi:hypothetical protein